MREADVTLADYSRRLHGRRGLKSNMPQKPIWDIASPPSRAAWIEMAAITLIMSLGQVAAFTGGVD